MPLAVIFDIDGTLVDTNYQHALAWYRAFRQEGIVMPIWRIHRAIGIGSDRVVEMLAGEEVEIWPSRGTNAVPIAFNPITGLIYASTWNVPRIQKLAAPKPTVQGKDSTGIIARIPENKPGDVLGYFAAINPLTGEKKWEVPLTDLPSSAGMLATRGGLDTVGCGAGRC